MKQSGVFRRLLKNKPMLWSAFFALFALVFIPLQPASAGIIASTVVTILSVPIQLFVKLMGWVFVLISHVLINWVAPYNRFVNSATVVEGWVILRDISNMFFIIVLLAIAFGTMFGREEELGYKKYLPRLLVMAVLINFSKTIVGLIIDAGQVVMLTFVNAFQAAAAGNLALGLGIPGFFDVPDQVSEVGGFEALIGLIFGGMLMAIAVITMAVLTVTLIWRIVNLWILIVLSPLAFFLSTFKKGQEYYSQWWKSLICWVGNGPILAFFLWLALATMVASGSDISTPPPGIVGVTEGPRIDIPGSTGIPTEAASEGNIAKFLIGIGLLLIGMDISKKFCEGAMGAGLDKGPFGLGIQGIRQRAEGATAWAAKKLTTGPAKLAWKGVKTGIAFTPLGRLGGLGGILGRAGGAVSRVPGLGGVGAAVAGAGGAAMAARAARATRAYEGGAETATRAAAAAAATGRPQDFARMVPPQRRVYTPETAGRDAAYLHTALTNSDIRRQAGPGETKNMFTRLQDLAQRSGSPTAISGLRDVERRLPHLISDDQEKIRVARGITENNALDVDAAALADPLVVQNLRPKAKERIREHGSPEQIAAIERAAVGPAVGEFLAGAERVGGAALRREAETARTRPDTIADPARRREAVQRLNPAELQALAPDVTARVFTDMNADQKMESLTAGRVPLDQIPKEHISAPDSAVAISIAMFSKPQEIAEMSRKEPEKAAAMRERLEDARAQGLAPNFRKEINVAMALTGAPAKIAFPTNEELVSAIKSDAAPQIVGKMKPEELDSDPGLRRAVAENIDVDNTLAKLAVGAPDERAIAKKIADAITKSGNDERLAEVISNVATRELIERGPGIIT